MRPDAVWFLVEAFDDDAIVQRAKIHTKLLKVQWISVE
jgi:hypothetical protein